MLAKLIELVPATNPSKPSVKLTAFVNPTIKNTTNTHLNADILISYPLKKFKLVFKDMLTK